MALPPSPVLVTKLKDGIEETIVFLRTLEGAKLSAVIERRRKGLLDQLLGLVGDTIKETPPSYEPKEAEATNAGSKDEANKAARPGSAGLDKKSPASTSPEKSVAKQPESTATLDKKQQPEKTATLDKKQPEKTATLDKKQPEKTATLDKKQQPEKTGPSENSDHLSAPLVASSKASPILGKKNNKPVNNPDNTAPSVSAKETPQTPKKSSAEAQVPGEVQSATAETPESATENNEGCDSPSAKPGKNMFGRVKGIFGGKKRDRDSVAPSEAAGEPSTPEESAATPPEPPIAEEQCQDYATPVCTRPNDSTELQGKLTGHLERQVKGKFGSTNWTKQLVVIKDDSIVVDMKTIPLSGCTVKDKGSTGFKLTMPDSEYVVLRTENEEARRRWVAAVAEVIAACTPVEEVSAAVEQEKGELPVTKEKAAVPQISVTSENLEDGGGGGGEPLYKNVSIKGSEDSLRKHCLEMPDQKVATMKGIVNRKTTFSWEKRWALLTSEPCLYLSQSESSTECLARLPLEAGKFECKKKGHDKSSASFVVKSGKKEETFSVSQGEISDWQSAIEIALGINSGDLELASSDEDQPDDTQGDTYEDIGGNSAGSVPSSARPVSVSSDPGECIYEECDEVPSGPVPSLPPPRAAQKELSSAPGPSLPPRKENPVLAAPAPAKGPQKDKETPAKGPQKDKETPAKGPQKDKDTPAKGPQKDKETPAKGLPAASLPSKSTPSTAGIPARPKPPPTVTAADKKPADKGPPQKPAPVIEDEVYDDIAESAPDDSYYDDTASALSGAKPQQDDEYVDVNLQEDIEDYVPVELGAEEEEEQYVDVDSPQETTKRHSFLAPASASSHETQPSLPLPPRETRASQPPAPHRSPAPAPKLTPSAVKNKVSSLSTMFEANKKKEGGGGCCGQVMHKGPAQSSTYRDEWAVLEGSTAQQAVLSIQRTATDKKPYTLLSICEYDLTIGSDDDAAEGGGAFTFKLAKNEVHHLFGVKSQEELDKWMLALRPFAKRVIVTEPKSIYQVTEDHTPTEGGDQLTLKKDTFVQVLKEKSPTLWIGQCGNYHEIFAGPIGTFPSSKVQQVSADDVYM